MIRKILVASAVTASAAVAAPSFAQDVEVSGNVALTTDYVWRGWTQANSDPAIQGGFDLSAGSFYAGTWASTVDFGDATDTNLEVDFYAGFAGEMESGLGWDVGFVYYAYPDSSDSDLDFVEVYGGLSYELEGGVGIGATVYVDPDNETVYAEAGAGFSLTDALSADANIGKYLDGFDEATNFNVGATYATPVGVDVDLRFTYVDEDGNGGEDDALVLTFSKAL